MKKRLFALALVGILAASCLTGCGDSSTNSDSSSSSAASDSASDSSDDNYNISLIVKLTDGHFNKVIAGAKAYADEHSNVTVDVLSPTSATAYDEQINMIETALGTDSCDAIVISPLQSDSAANLVANTDKTIIACDTDFDSDKKSAFVGTGNEEAAYQGGKAAVESKIADGIEKPTAIILTGVQGDETHDARLNGYKKGVKEAGGDAYKDTLFCGFDGNQSALEAIQDGTIGMDVAQEGYQMGYKSVEAAVTVLSGESVDEFIDSGSTVVDTDNVDDYIQQMKDIGVWED